jgi:hypothetical protein
MRINKLSVHFYQLVCSVQTAPRSCSRERKLEDWGALSAACDENFKFQYGKTFGGGNYISNFMERLTKTTKLLVKIFHREPGLPTMTRRRSLSLAQQVVTTSTRQTHAQGYGIVLTALFVAWLRHHRRRHFTDYANRLFRPLVLLRFLPPTSWPSYVSAIRWTIFMGLKWNVSLFHPFQMHFPFVSTFCNFLI